MVTDIIPETKCCSRCNEIKETALFILRCNICRLCNNTRKKEQNAKRVVDMNSTRECNSCSETKMVSSFVKKNAKICKDCNNTKRRMKYENDENHRLKIIQTVCSHNRKKVIERQQAKLDEIGEGNKKCSCCSEIKPACKFRYNRLKCRNCERDDPADKFKRNVRSRIYIALNAKKVMHTIQYLGATSDEYLQWILHNDNNYTLENRGKWHIDHVIPLSRFNLDDEEQQLVAFNWRNTMPLDAKENLKKNNRLDTLQIEQHYKKLSGYHKEKNIDFPQVFIDLFARHLVAGNPLEPLLPL